MPPTKNTLTLSLMTGSIILVLILQGFWLKSSFKDARARFIQKTGFLFRTTVMDMQDSLIRENFRQVPPDSLHSYLAEERRFPDQGPFPEPGSYEEHGGGEYGRHDRHGRYGEQGLFPDLPVHGSWQRFDSSGVAILISAAGPDGEKGGSEPGGNVAFSRRKEGLITRYFILNRADSLHTKDIGKKYRAVLTEAGIQVPFKVLAIPFDTAMTGRRGFPFPPLRGKFTSDAMRTLYFEADREDAQAEEANRHDPAKEESGRDRTLKDGGKAEEAQHNLSTGTEPPSLSAFGEGRQGVREWIHSVAPDSAEKGSLILDPVLLPLTGAVTAQFRLQDYRWLLLREIAPQLLFSLVMILFISVSFYFMYRSMRMQQRLMELKNDFVSNVTHELKTPVATAGVAIEALRNFRILDDPVRTAEYLEIAQQELNRLTLLTDNILKAAAFESKGGSEKLEKVDLGETLDEVLASMRLVFEKKGAEVSFDRGGRHFVVDGTQAGLANVFYNLLDNALKYSPAVPRISIWLKELRNGVQLSVRDNGIGIAPQYHGKVFEKFFRVPNGDVHNIKGHGLGLSYVAGVVKDLGGNISLESQSGKGSCFIIYLPRHHEKD